MSDKSLVRRVLVRTILPVLALGLAGMWFAANLDFGNVAVAADMSQQDFEQRVRTYLLEHPEVVGEALGRLKAKQGEQDAAAAKSVLKSHADDLYQDPNSPVGGNPDGGDTLVEFFDYNCPYCKMMAPVMEQAEAADSQLRVVFKEFPILGADSVIAARAALAANKQGKYIAFHHALYQVRGHVDEAKVLETAQSVGIDVERMKPDMQDAGIEAELRKNVSLGQALGITGTPGFVIGDRVTTGARDLQAFQALIGAAQQAEQKSK